MERNLKTFIDLKTSYIKEMLPTLLKDVTTGENIIFATDIYSKINIDFFATEHITEKVLEQIDLQPRVAKSIAEQNERTRSNAEVFTPSWICNKMNNYLDKEWFGRKNVFNTEKDTTWNIVKAKVDFPAGKTWEDYVSLKVLEITCGEAPFLVSRYDSSTGEYIEVENRIGILDRKIRVINENCDSAFDWVFWVNKAFQSVYGYEYQGDNLLIARINLLNTFVDCLTERWKRESTKGELQFITNTIVHNLWQMDGLSGAVPFKEACENQDQTDMMSMFFDEQNENYNCRISNWELKKTFEFNDIKEGKAMKFDYVIGNPPYQDETLGENDTYAPPVYHKFMDAAYEICDKVELIHPARFLFNAGSTPKAWNQKMLNNPCFTVFDYEPTSQKVFPNKNVPGGIAITYFDKNKHFGQIEVFSQYAHLNDIRNKVVSSDGFKSMSSIVYSAYNYHFDEALYKDYPLLKNRLSKGHEYDLKSNSFELLNEVFTDQSCSSDDIQILGRHNNRRCLKWINKKYIVAPQNLTGYKVFVAGADGAAGTIGKPIPARVSGVPSFGNKNVGNTESFISIGNFNAAFEAKSCIKYIKSKFARTLLSLLKVTQANTPKKWNFVPLQDFSNNSDIDWSKSISEIDQQLYKKYGLDEDEIAFIETYVEEMA